MLYRLSCVGLKCPLPVIKTKKFLDNIQNGELFVTVDNDIAKQNILKLVASLNYSAIAEKKINKYEIRIYKNEDKVLEKEMKIVQKNIVEIAYLVTSSELGKGDKDLGQFLIRSLFYTLNEKEKIPKFFIFLNQGVVLTCQKSNILEILQNMEQKGTKILSCGACLDFYKLTAKLNVGKITNMYEVTEILENCKVIKF